MKTIRPLTIALVLLLGSNFAALADAAITSDGTITHSYQSSFGASQMDTLASTGTKGTLIGTFSADFSQNKTFTLSFSAPTGMQFAVDPSGWLGKGDVRLVLSFYSANALNPPFNSGGGVFEWIGVSGSAPTVSATTDQHVGSGSPQAFSLNAKSASITQAFSFAGFTYTITAPESFTAVYNNASWYAGDIYFQASSPFGANFTPTNTGMPDPGQIVTLVPEPNSLVMLSLGVTSLGFLRRRR